MDGYLLDLPHIDPFQRWTLICAVALTLLYLFMRPRRKRKDPLARPSSLSLAGQREVEKQMTELLVELEQMARQMTSQLETRSTKLELLIREADARIASLQSAGASAPAHEPAQLEQVPPCASLSDPRHGDIYEMADRGDSAHDIAQRLSRPHGEIELILALRGHQNAALSAASR
jgi:hypothetical protein